MTRSASLGPPPIASSGREAGAETPTVGDATATPSGPLAGDGRSRTTLADVAREAGVSIATASRAVSGHGQVADGTRARVLAAAARLDFQPSAVGRSLRLQRTGLIGFVVPDISSPFYANALKGAQHRLEAAGYQVALLDTDERPEREIEALRALVGQQVDGIVLCSTDQTGMAVRALDPRHRPPLVFFDNLAPGLGDGSAALENEGGIRLLVDHLAVVHGHRRIGYIGGYESETSGSERLAGFRLAVAAHGLDHDPSLARAGDWTHASGSRETAALLALEARPTAIVYADAAMAIGGLAVLREHRIAIGSELAIVSFDDWDAGAFMDPPLTALARRDRQIGDVAASLLLRVLDQADAGSVDVRLPMDLIVRRSCGCRP